MSRGFLDLLFNVLLAFVFLFLVSSMLIQIEKKETGIQTQAEFIITVTWDDNDPDDVDSWLRDPLGNVTWFRHKEEGIAHLDRDDLGHQKDSVVLPDGTEVVYPYNQEITTIRQIIKGWWVFNIHMYSKRQEPITHVTVKCEKVNPTIQTMFYEEFVMASDGDEITVRRFRLNAAGEMVEQGQINTPMVREHLAREHLTP